MVVQVQNFRISVKERRRSTILKLKMKIEYLYGKDKKLYQVTYIASKFRMFHKTKIPLQTFSSHKIYFSSGNEFMDVKTQCKEITKFLVLLCTLNRMKQVHGCIKAYSQKRKRIVTVLKGNCLHILRMLLPCHKSVKWNLLK